MIPAFLALLLEERENKGVCLLPSFHTILRNLRSTTKSTSGDSYKKENLVRQKFRKIYFSKTE
jgi:hypothetical protein